MKARCARWLACGLLIAGCSDGGTGPGTDSDIWLAFVSRRDGNDEIYGLDVANGLQNLTRNAAEDRDPVWSPDGTRLAFTRSSTGGRDVYVLEVATGSLLNLTAHPADDRDPVWSPSGEQLAFVSDRDGDDEIYRVAADGDGLLNLTRHPGPDRDPDWSLTGLLAFTSGRGLRAAVYLMNDDGTGVRRLSAGIGADDAVPTFSPDGAHVAFESNRDGASEVVVVRTDGTEERVLAAHGAHDVGPVWAPDGVRVAFLSNRDDGWDVWVVGLDGTGLVTLASNSRAREAGPAWSPDGTRIAFETRRNANWDVFIAGSNGLGGRALIADGENDGSPAWRPPTAGGS